MKKIGFIGIGTMAKAMIKGLVASNFEAKIYGYDWHENNYDFLTESGILCCKSSSELVSCSDFLVLAIKPQNMAEALQQMKLDFNNKIVLISIAAGIDESFISLILEKKIKLVRAMPNTPLLLGKGAVALSRGLNVDEKSFDFVKKMFETSGVVCEIDSAQMNDVVAINGSSPAFIYLFAKGFLNFASKKGMNSEVALKLFCASLIGSATMMEKSNKTIDELIADVSSKGGTTIAGLSVLKEFNLTKIVEQTCEKAAKRAFELSKLN